MADDDEQAIMMIRELFSFIPSNNMEEAPIKPCSDNIKREDEKLQTLIPADPNKPYNMLDLITSVADNHHFFEVQPHFAPNIVIGFAHLGAGLLGFLPINLRILPVFWTLIHQQKEPVLYASAMHSISQLLL